MCESAVMSSFEWSAHVCCFYHTGLNVMKKGPHAGIRGFVSSCIRRTLVSFKVDVRGGSLRSAEVSGARKVEICEGGPVIMTDHRTWAHYVCKPVWKTRLSLSTCSLSDDHLSFFLCAFTFCF